MSLRPIWSAKLRVRSVLKRSTDHTTCLHTPASASLEVCGDCIQLGCRVENLPQAITHLSKSWLNVFVKNVGAMPKTSATHAIPVQMDCPDNCSDGCLATIGVRSVFFSNFQQNTNAPTCANSDGKGFRNYNYMNVGSDLPCATTAASPSSFAATGRIPVKTTT